MAESEMAELYDELQRFMSGGSQYVIANASRVRSMAWLARRRILILEAHITKLEKALAAATQHNEERD